MAPSGGSCQTCRIRRIKCDGNRPICQRCLKSKRICLPVPTIKQASFSIHSENQYASGQTKRPRGPRSNLTVPQPAADLETKALAYYEQYHLQSIDDGPFSGGGLPECAAAWKASGRADEMVNLALTAMALAVYSRTQNDPSAVDEAASRYHKLLQFAQDRIAKIELPTLNENDIDACLFTIFLMGRYEGVMVQPGHPNQKDSFEVLSTWSHHDGVVAILKVWHDRLSHNTASHIVKHSRRGQIRSAILRSRLLPEWLEDGSRFGERGVDLSWDRLIIRTVLFRQSLACYQRKNHVSNADVEQLSQEAETIDQALQDLISLASHQCRPRQHHVDITPNKLPIRHFYSQKVYSYATAKDASIWNQYYATRMLLCNTQLKILGLANPDLLTHCVSQREASPCIGRLKASANDLAASVPFSLDRFKTTSSESTPDETELVMNKSDDIRPWLTGLLIWPLTIAASIGEIDSELRRWFKTELANLGKISGDSILACADTDQWIVSL